MFNGFICRRGWLVGPFPSSRATMHIPLTHAACCSEAQPLRNRCYVRTCRGSSDFVDVYARRSQNTVAQQGHEITATARNWQKMPFGSCHCESIFPIHFTFINSVDSSSILAALTGAQCTRGTGASVPMPIFDQMRLLTIFMQLSLGPWHGEGHSESYRGLLFVFEHNSVVRIILIKLPRWGGQERYALDSLWDVAKRFFHWVCEESGYNNNHVRLNWIDVLLKRFGFSIKKKRKNPKLEKASESSILTVQRAHTHKRQSKPTIYLFDRMLCQSTHWSIKYHNLWS